MNLEKTYTISELSAIIKKSVQSCIDGSFWLTGEIQRFEINANKKHIFFELFEKEKEKDQVAAKINAVIWESTKTVISRRLRDAGNQFILRDGIQVKFLCKLDYYAPSGSLQAVIQDIDPQYTFGQIALARAMTIERLKKENLLELNKSLKFPLIPLRMGLITSIGSAAYNDFIDELARSGYQFYVLVFSSSMQGKQAEIDVPQGIKMLSKSREVDFIVVTRGGGAKSDLACFDTYSISSAIAKSSKPVITGLGHEIDVSVSDLVSFNYLKTPTAAAEFIVSRVEELDQMIDELAEGIAEKTEDLLDENNINLEKISEKLRYKSEKLVSIEKEDIRKSADFIEKSVSKRLGKENNLLFKYQSMIFQKGISLTNLTANYFSNMIYKISNKAQIIAYKTRLVLDGFKLNKFMLFRYLNGFQKALDDNDLRMRQIVRKRMETEENYLKMLEMSCNEFDVRRILKKGFTLLRKENGAVAKSVKDIAEGEHLFARFHDGNAKMEVEEITNE
ncbi:MAG: exodeoxyribonuclease VII large subunit [Candidatus Coatesbacteria bacterium]|nr:exodeoxyribonuclease VII large subunit [Candidatus Coatesbacteria bacterium]